MSKTTKQIEQLVNEATTRRGFLGRMTRTAGTAVAAITGILATRSVEAGAGHGKGPNFKKRLCCVYWVGWDYPDWAFVHCTNKKSCPEEYQGGILSDYYYVDS